MQGPDKEFYDELVAGYGVGIVGRGMYDAAGGWGGTNPFPGPLFVLTHRTEDAPAAEAGFTFVSGLGDALAQAAQKAGGKDVAIGGRADVIRQALAAGRVDELVLSTAPVILGAGKRLFDGSHRDIDLEVIKAVGSPYATHVRYAVRKSAGVRRGKPAASPRIERPGTYHQEEQPATAPDFNTCRGGGRRNCAELPMAGFMARSTSVFYAAPLRRACSPPFQCRGCAPHISEPQASLLVRPRREDPRLPRRCRGMPRLSPVGSTGQ